MVFTTLPSMQQSRMKSHRIGHQTARGSLFRPTYILKLKTTLQRGQIALTLMPPLEVHGVIE